MKRLIWCYLILIFAFSIVKPIEAEASFVEMEAETNNSTVSDQEQLEMCLYFEGILKEAILAGEEYISVADMEIPSADYRLTEIEYLSPYFGNGIEIHAWVNSATKMYHRLQIENPMTLEETKAYFEKVDKRLNAIKEQADESLPDALKALIIYEEVVEPASYGALYDSNGEYMEETGSASGVLMYGKGVCDSYTYAILYLANMLGMECYRTVSDEMNHSWNIIKIDDEYYHIDGAWFDDGAETLGQLSHTLFLCSDAMMIEKNHSGRDLTNIVCDDTTYDGSGTAYWRLADTRVLLKDGYAYYIREKSIYKRKIDTGVEEVLLKDLGTWKIWGSQYNWMGAFSGLSLYDGELYYNTPYEIRKISIDGSNDTLVFKPDTTDGYVYGCRIENGMIQFRVQQSEIDEVEIQSIPLKEEQPKELPFTDVPKHEWYYGAVEYVYQNEIMSGLKIDKFGPDETLTRAQFATILYRSAGSPEVTYDNRFSDIPANDWYSDAVIWANNVGVVTGLTATTYGPEAVITREQMATMMYRYANYLEYNTGTLADLDSYTDASKVSSYAVEPMRWAVGNGIINGKTSTTLDPLGQATRAECATIIMRFLEKYK